MTKVPTNLKMFKVREMSMFGDPTETDVGLYFTRWNKILHGGKKKRGVYYTGSALSMLPGLSQTTVSKINSARVGTKIKVSQLSNTHALYFIRVSDEEVAEKANLSHLQEQLAQVEDEINRAIPAALIQRRRELQQQINQVKKEMK